MSRARRSIACSRDPIGLGAEDAATYIGVSVGALEYMCSKELVQPPHVLLDQIIFDKADLPYLSRPERARIEAESGRPRGSVYFVGFDGYVKIGWSTDVFARIADLQTAAPQKLTLYGRIKGTLSDEKALHDRFAAYRLNGEWFRFSDEIKAYLQEIAPL